MGLCRVAFGGSRIGNDGAQHHERRTGALGVSRLERRGYGGEIIAVTHPQNLPAVGLEPAAHILREGQSGVAVDGDVVVVIHHGELAQAQVPRDRGGLAGHPLHEVAVAGECPHPMIHDRVVGPVEVIGEKTLRDSHPDGVGEPLPQWAGCRLHAGGMPALGVAGCAGSPLPEVPDFLQREIVPAQVQQGVEQHRGMPAGKHEPIAVGPLGITRIMTEKTAPEHVRGGREGHRRAGVPGLSLLYRIHREGANRVDAPPGQFRPRVSLAGGRDRVRTHRSSAGALCVQDELLSGVGSGRG